MSSLTYTWTFLLLESHSLLPGCWGSVQLSVLACLCHSPCALLIKYYTAPKIYGHYLALSPWQRFGRLPVTCVGGFAWTEWELHNSLYRERVWLCFEMRISLTKNAMELFQSMWLTKIQTRRLHFSLTCPASVILTHDIIFVSLAAAPVLILSCVWGLLSADQRSLWRVFALLVKAAGRPLMNPKPSVSLAEGENPRVLRGEACLGETIKTCASDYVWVLLLLPLRLLFAFALKLQVSDSDLFYQKYGLHYLMNAE